MKKRHLLRLTALALAVLLPASAGWAQDFPPKKAVTVVVGFAAGGAADAAARLIARKLGENIGQTVVVDNKSGAGGNIAHQLLANGPADGSMLLLGSIGPLTDEVGRHRARAQDHGRVIAKVLVAREGNLHHESR